MNCFGIRVKDWADVSKLISTCPEEHFEVILSKKVYRNFFSHFEKKVLTGVFKTDSNVSKEAF